MKLIKKCVLCSKLLFFNSIEYNNLFYCKDCLEIQKQNEYQEKIKKEEQRKALLQIKQEKNKIKEIQANEFLKKQLELEEKIRIEKLKKKKEKEIFKQIKSSSKDVDENKTNIKNFSNKIIYFSKEEIINNDRLLYIYADVKRVLVIDWLKGKKKIILNKNREIRRTHAGGFSAEKFQKFVDFKKKTASDWIFYKLSIPGVIRKPYNLIKIESDNEDFKKSIENFIDNY
jgi:hypothetical protein